MIIDRSNYILRGNIAIGKRGHSKNGALFVGFEKDWQSYKHRVFFPLLDSDCIMEKKIQREVDNERSYEEKQIGYPPAE